MTNRDGQTHVCENVDGALLVEYCDGELSALELARVEEHLEQCSGCRSQVAALRASLDIAQEIWNEPVKEIAGSTAGCGHTRRRLRVAGAFAAIAAAVIVCIVWWPDGGQRQQDTIDAPSRLTEKPSPLDAPSAEPLEADDVEAMILRQVQSARLAAAADVLAADPDLKSYHDRARKYLADAYGAVDDETHSEQGI